MKRTTEKKLQQHLSRSMDKPPRSHQIAHDSPQYAEMWAVDLVAAVGNREARRILDDYKALAGNKRIAEADRAVAAERVKALQKRL